VRSLPARVPPVRPAPASDAEAADDAQRRQRRRRLGRLARDLWDLRPPIAYVQYELHRLAARTQARPLSREEVARVRVLRRERAALWRRLRVYALEYERLTRPLGRPAAAPGRVSRSVMSTNAT
jgi:hypothetical protein